MWNELRKIGSKESVLKKNMEGKYDKIANIVRGILDKEIQLHHGTHSIQKRRDMVKMEVYGELRMVYDSRAMFGNSDFIDDVIDDIFEERGLPNDKKKTWFS